MRSPGTAVLLLNEFLMIGAAAAGPHTLSQGGGMETGSLAERDRRSSRTPAPPALYLRILISFSHLQ